MSIKYTTEFSGNRRNLTIRGVTLRKCILVKVRGATKGKRTKLEGFTNLAEIMRICNMHHLFGGGWTIDQICSRISH